MQLTIKCQINHQKTRASLTQPEAGMLWYNCRLPTLSQLHFFACYNLYLGPFWAIVARSCCNVAAQPRMLQRSELKCAKQFKHGNRTRNKCRCRWRNVESTIRKAKSSLTQEKAGMQRENWCLPTTPQLHFFPLHNPYLAPF